MIAVIIEFEPIEGMEEFVARQNNKRTKPLIIGTHLHQSISSHIRFQSTIEFLNHIQTENIIIFKLKHIYVNTL